MKKLIATGMLSVVLAIGAVAQTSGVVPVNGRKPVVSDRALQRVVRDVRHELVMLPRLEVFDHLAFKVDGDTVTLLGAVTRPSLKSDAERVLRDIEGVERVVNQIEVLPVSSHDDRLRLELYRSIFGNSFLTRYGMGTQPSLRILVSRGHVRLEGVVDSENDKNVATLMAKSVPGVFTVQNNLVIHKSR